LTSRNGPYGYSTFGILGRGTVYYPRTAPAPWGGVAVCGGFVNTGPEMNNWGEFYASHGIVTIITNTGALDLPDLRGTKLVQAIQALRAENTRAGSPLFGKMADRYGTSGYSMGGGGTTLASRSMPTLKTSVGLAPWAPTGIGVTVPTLLMCGSADIVAPCSGAQGAYNQIPATTPKMGLIISGGSHLTSWFGPTDLGSNGGATGEAALAFQKVYLEGDERWKPFLLRARGTMATNIR
jgi:hypothetical protein